MEKQNDFAIFSCYFGRNKTAKPNVLQYSNWTGIAWNKTMVDQLHESYHYYKTESILPLCTGISSYNYVSIRMLLQAGLSKRPDSKEIVKWDPGLSKAGRLGLHPPPSKFAEVY